MKLSSLLLLRREDGGTGILFDPDDGKTFFLNPVAMLICTLLQEEELDYSALMGKVVPRLRELPPEAEGEIRSFLRTLQEHGYLAVNDGDLPEET